MRSSTHDARTEGMLALPSDLRAEDNEAGSRLSLEQLARRFD
jgi:hypothetical protein